MTTCPKHSRRSIRPRWLNRTSRFASASPLSISSDGSDPANQTDEDGKFEVNAGTGMRVLLVMGPETPMPIVIKPIQVGDEDMDVGDLKQGGMPQGAMALGGGGPE